MASYDYSRAGGMGREYRQGDHICSAYETREEQLAVAVHYIAEGLARNERCLYAAESQDALDAFRHALRGHGFDAGALERAGGLLMMTKDMAHLQGGCFDCEQMLAMLNETVEAALNDGYVGLRTCGDMSWLLDEAPGSEQVVEYEALLNEFFASVRATGMCQYDASRLPEGLLSHALDTHTSVVAGGRHRANPYYRKSDPARFTDKISTIRSSTL